MATIVVRSAWLTVLLAILCTIGSAQLQQSAPITITLAGQSMIQSDIRATAPAAIALIQGVLKGDAAFTNLEAAVAEKGETVHEGRGFLTPAEALDALTTFGFNLLALSGNHAFDLKVTGIQNTIREAEQPEDRSRGNRKQPGRSGSAGLSAHRQGHHCPDRERVRPDYAGSQRHCGPAGRE
jgi:hypothetical protein